MEIFAQSKRFRRNPKSILFVTSQLRQREIKMAHALKSCGWSVGLIYYNATPFKPEACFDFAWEVTSAKQAHKYAMKVHPQLIHLFSGAIDDYVMLFCKDKVAPIIIDLNDIFTPSLMDYCPERYLPTREVLALADGLCARDLQVKCAEKIDNCQIPDHLLLFPEYCWNTDNNSTHAGNEGEVHVVSVGTISLETYGMYDCCYVELVKEIIKQQIHFHIYPPWHYRKDHPQFDSVNFERDYADFIALAKDSPYLHIHDSLPAKELAKELPKYDFGVISGGCEAFGQRYTHFKPAYVEACYSGRIADYLDAGMPVLINEEVAFDYWLLKRYGVCVDLKEVFQPDFKGKLHMLKHDPSMKKQLIEAKQRLSIKENAHRLTTFYASVVRSAKRYPNRYYARVLSDLFSLVPRGIKKVGRYLTA